MYQFKNLALLALPAVIVASPVANAPNPQISSIINSWECLAVNFIVNSLKSYPSATPFCSSYLKIPTVTSTATSTSTSVVQSVSTCYTGTTTSTSTITSTVTNSAIANTCASGTTSAAPYHAREVLEDRNPNNKPPCTTSSTTTSTPTMKTTTTTTPCTTSKPQPKPTLPSCVSSFESSAISTACNCLAIPTPTSTAYTTITTTSTSKSVTSAISTVSTTITTTITLTATLPPTSCSSSSLSTSLTTSLTSSTTSSTTPSSTPTSCPNTGLQWAAYNNTSGPDYGGSDHYPSFLPETYKTSSPLYTSTTSTLGLNISDSGAIISIYSSPPIFESEYFILNHRGYLHATVAGTYTFSATSVDDTVCLWLGDEAKSGWVRANDDLDVGYDNGLGSGSVSVVLEAGEYLPIRVVFAQAQGGGEFGLSVTGPDGGVGELVQFSCDGVSAPRYAQDFGAET